MCGIVGYIGERKALPILINGLKRLEYRGYDSAGIAIHNGEKLHVHKKKGKVADLERDVKDKNIDGHIGIGHTRWATHGEPNDVNAHPHVSQNGLFVLIHNGIIENYKQLKNFLIDKGYQFKSETDTEVLVNLIEYMYLEGGTDAEMAVRLALSEVIGAYAIVVISTNEPDKLIAARKSSPLVIGLGKGEYFLASDATPIVEYTNRVVYLDNDNIAILKKDEFVLKNLDNQELSPIIQNIDFNLAAIEKNGYDHFMLKEIFEQPDAIHDTMRGRISSDGTMVRLGGIMDVMDKILKAERFVIVGCGTSWHAGLVGEYLIENLARIPVEVEYGSEFRYRNPIIKKEDIVIAISQSGETADTLAAVELAKHNEATVLGICNVVGSSIARETHAGVYTHAGPEIGVASTKAFTAQVTVLSMFSLMLSQEKGTLPYSDFKYLVKELQHIPGKIARVLEQNAYIRDLADRYKNATNFLYLGRGYLYPVALEGALKLKEISYIHAEGYPAAEMKHGPIALIDENMPVVFLATKDKIYEKVLNNIEEVKSRGGRVIAIATEGDETVRKMVDHIIEVPHVPEPLAPLVTVVPLQLLAYHAAVLRGNDVDQPRNLAKSVTVE